MTFCNEALDDIIKWGLQDAGVPSILEMVGVIMSYIYNANFYTLS